MRNSLGDRDDFNQRGIEPKPISQKERGEDYRHIRQEEKEREYVSKGFFFHFFPRSTANMSIMRRPSTIVGCQLLPHTDF